MTLSRLPRGLWILTLLCACVQGPPADEQVSVPPDGDALRVVTLAPHLAELVFAVGAGDLLVGVSAYTDYPEPVKALPVIGDAFMVDQEQLALLRPDFLLAWESGTAAHVVDRLRLAGFQVEVVRTRSLGDVGRALEHVGALTGHAEEAGEVARRYREALHELADQYASRVPVRVFYQVAQRPIYTINGDHYVSELIESCGGRNIFEDLRDLAPVVSEEAVLERDPEVLLAAGDADQDVFGNWQHWPGLSANRYRNHYLLPAAEIGRASPRLISAGRTLCDALENGRANRQAVQASK